MAEKWYVIYGCPLNWYNGFLVGMSTLNGKNVDKADAQFLVQRLKDNLYQTNKFGINYLSIWELCWPKAKDSSCPKSLS